MSETYHLELVWGDTNDSMFVVVKKFILDLGSFLSKDFLSKFPDFFSRNFFNFHIFHFFFQLLECEAFRIFCPLLNFQALGMPPVFPSFPVLLGKKKEENFGKKMLDKSGPFSETNCFNRRVREFFFFFLRFISTQSY